MELSKKAQKITGKILKECLGHKRGESVLILTDDKLYPIAEVFFQGALYSGIEAILLKIKAGRIHGEEPPYLVNEVLNRVHIALLITEKSLSHTQARLTASKKYGVRIASLPGINKEILERSLLIDYTQLKKSANRLTDLLTKGKSVRIETAQGTKLDFSIAGRKGLADDGLYILRGAFGNLPAGESCIGPVEGTANGRLIVDASFAGLGKLIRPIEIIIKNGKAVEIDSPQLRKLLQPLGTKALNIAEFGIGLNPKAKVTGVVLEDEKALKTAHIALGNNKSFGGKVSAPCHLDGVFYNPRVFIDGKQII